MASEVLGTRSHILHLPIDGRGAPPGCDKQKTKNKIISRHCQMHPWRERMSPGEPLIFWKNEGTKYVR